MEGRFRAADFNLCPVAREHDAARRDRIIDCDLTFRDFDVLALVASLHIRVKCPAEQQHFRARERQHRPETQPGGEAGDAESGEAHAAENSNAPRGLSEQCGARSMWVAAACTGARLYQRICRPAQALTSLFAVATAQSAVGSL